MRKVVFVFVLTVLSIGYVEAVDSPRCETPKTTRALIVMPAGEYIGGESLAVHDVLQYHDYQVRKYIDHKIEIPPDVTLRGYVDHCDTMDIGVLHIATESSTPMDMAFECYPATAAGLEARNSAFDLYTQLYPGECIAEGYYDSFGREFYWLGFCGTSIDQVQDRNTIVVAASCSSGVYGNLIWNTREMVGFPYKVTEGTAASQCAIFYGGLNGGYGIQNRRVENAKGLTIFMHHGNGKTTLSPAVIDIQPPSGSILSTGSVELRITFDTKIDITRDPNRAIRASGPVQIQNRRWGSGEVELKATLKPYDTGPVSIKLVASEILSRENGVELDGDGWGPNGDDLVIPYQSTYVDANTAARFVAASARETPSGYEVRCVTYPEHGSVRLYVDQVSVEGGVTRIARLDSADAVGGPDRAEEYVWTIPFDRIDPAHAPLAFRVEEVDDDPFTRNDVTRPFVLSAGDAEEAPELRAPEDVRVEEEIARRKFGEIPEDVLVDFRKPTKRSDLQMADVFFATTDSLMMSYTNIVGVLLSSRFGLSYRLWYLASPDAAALKEIVRDHDSLAAAVGWPTRPTLCIVGSPHVNPDSSIVDTYRYDDPTGQCYWSPCASDQWITDMDGDGKADWLTTRVPGFFWYQIWESVYSWWQFLDGEHVGPPGALLMEGDVDGWCDRQGTIAPTMDAIEQIYASHAIPTTRYVESDYCCLCFQAKRDAVVDRIDAGLREIVGLGLLSGPTVWPGYGIQREFEPRFKMSDLSQRQRLILIMPNCGVGFADDSETFAYPNIVFDFFTAPHMLRASAVFGVLNMRGGVALNNGDFATLFVEKSFQDYPTALHAAHAAIDAFEEPEGNPYIRTVANFGWPGVQYRPNMSYVGVEEAVPRIARPELLGNRPNPFNPETTIEYSLPGRSTVSLRVYTLSGRLVRTLLDRKVQWEGTHEALWNGTNDEGRDVASGVYFVRLAVEQMGRTEERTGKILLVR